MRERVKEIVSMVLYRAVGEKITNNNFDVLSHNTSESMDNIFRDPKFLDKYKSLSRKFLYEYIIGFLPEEGASVADFGAGPGFFLESAMQKKPDNKYIGYEFSQVAINIARENCPFAEICHHDLTIPVNRKFDVVVCSQTLEHILHPELVLINAINSLDSKGRLILTVPDGRKDTYRGHINFWSEESWKAWLENYIIEGWQFFSNPVIIGPGYMGVSLL